MSWHLSRKCRNVLIIYPYLVMCLTINLKKPKLDHQIMRTMTNFWVLLIVSKKSVSFLSEMKEAFNTLWNKMIVFSIYFKTFESMSQFTVANTGQIDKYNVMFLDLFSNFLSYMTYGKCHINNFMAWTKTKLQFWVNVISKMTDNSTE